MMAPSRTAPQADTLIDLWHSLALQHVALGAACGCGMGGVSLRLEDFELDIAGYLEDAGLRSGDPIVEGFFRDRGEPPAQPLLALLTQASRGELPDAVSQWMLPKVEHTLRSFAALHAPASGGGRA